MKILVLGGSHFVGRALVEVAIQAGHEVTTLNRGISGHHVNGAKLIRADRTNHDALASVIADRSWDSVVDTWSGPPNHATFAARTLGTHTGHYAYVSSRSVYTWPNVVGLDESHPTVEGDPDDLSSDDYARTKRGSELGILASRPDALLARAGLILGPYEDVGRLPWWLLRLERGGKVIAPGPSTRPLQYIDARDLARWMISCAEQDIGGSMNAVSQVGHTTMGELLGIARTITNSDAELVWFGPDEIEDARIAPWTELPIWVPPRGDLAGLHDCDVKRAFQTGLECRPVRETIEDTWNWLQIEGPPVQRNDLPIHGIDPLRETNLIKNLNR